MKKLLFLFTLLSLLAGCATSNQPSIQSAAERDWKPMNPSFYDQRR